MNAIRSTIGLFLIGNPFIEKSFPYISCFSLRGLHEKINPIFTSSKYESTIVSFQNID